MIPDNKEKWVINRLKKQGYKTDFNQYSDNEMMLYKSIKDFNKSFDWVDCLQFYISREKGCYIHFRPSKNPALHLRYHLSWPNTKNWCEINDFEAFIKAGFGIDNLIMAF